MFRTFHWGRSWRSSHDPPVVFLVQAFCDQQAPPTPTRQRGCFSDWQVLSHSGVSSNLSPPSSAAPRKTGGHTSPSSGTTWNGACYAGRVSLGYSASRVRTDSLVRGATAPCAAHSLETQVRNRKHKTQHRAAASTKRTAPADNVLAPSVSLQPRDSGVSPVLSQAKEGREREQSSISSVSLWPRAAGGEYATWPQANACRAANTPSHSGAPILPVSLGPQG